MVDSGSDDGGDGFRYDSPPETSPSESVVTAVSEVADTDHTELPTLFEAINPDALDALFQGRTDGEVSFEYSGFEVTVEGDGTVIVRSTDGNSTEK